MAKKKSATQSTITKNNTLRDHRLFNILVINPGSTSTKIALFQNNYCVRTITISHDPEDLKQFSDVTLDQLAYRKQAVLSTLEKENIDVYSLDAVVGRGGYMKPVESGTYLIDDRMVEDLKHPWSEHASNLGGIIAKEIADQIGVPAYTVDPVCVDEMVPVAKITGVKGFSRHAKWHPLNQKAVIRRLAKDLDVDVTDLNVIVVHMGGGISIGAHRNGKCIDVNNCIDGQGAFSPNRAGTMNFGDVIDMCYSGKYTKSEVIKHCIGQGGLVSYFGTDDVRVIEEKAKTDEFAALILEAMAYQISKSIGENAIALKGDVDAIILTGGLARSKFLVDKIEEYAGFLAPVYLYPGEYEMIALAKGAYRALSGQEKAKTYDPAPFPPEDDLASGKLKIS